jgi:hypothetical protein
MNHSRTAESASQSELMASGLSESDRLIRPLHCLLRITEKAKHQSGASEATNTRVFAEEMALLDARMKRNTLVAMLEGARLVSEEEERVAECPMCPGEELDIAGPFG